MKFIKLNDRYINLELIAYIQEPQLNLGELTGIVMFSHGGQVELSHEDITLLISELQEEERLER